jgi:hypothetical protein
MSRIDSQQIAEETGVDRDDVAAVLNAQVEHGWAFSRWLDYYCRHYEPDEDDDKGEQATGAGGAY